MYAETSPVISDNIETLILFLPKVVIQANYTNFYQTFTFYGQTLIA